jgi:hypothetical protein
MNKPPTVDTASTITIAMAYLVMSRVCPETAKHDHNHYYNLYYNYYYHHHATSTTAMSTTLQWSVLHHIPKYAFDTVVPLSWLI